MKKEKRTPWALDPEQEAAELQAQNAETARLRSILAEEERELRKACEEDYKACAETVEELFDAVSDNELTSFSQVDDALEQVQQLYQTYEGPLLLENMQLVRYDDSYYQYHAVNVSLLAAMIGRLAAVSTEDIQRLLEIGLVMDFGMLLLSHNIVSRSGRLNPGEKVRVRQHTMGSARTLRAVGIDDEKVIEAVLSHHERYNGGGYPKGISGESIPLLARIIAVADSFDAALARKEYGKHKTVFEVMMEIELNSNGALDPNLTSLTVRGIAEMLVGRYALLSDRSIGKIVKMEPGRYIYPEVIVVGTRVQTGPELYPVSLSSYLPLTYGSPDNPNQYRN